MSRFEITVLRFPRAYWIAAFLAIALAAPSVSADFFADDGVMVLRLEGSAPAPIPGPFHLYTFVSGAPEERHILVEHGPLPWWTSERLRISFFRPLSSALFAADQRIAGRRPLLYHLHTIAWYVAAVLAAGALLRRLLPPREAAAAALLFAASPAHWVIAAWPSARHVAVSGTFAFLAIALHLRGREREDLRARIGALLCAALALAGGETALGVFAYVAAYEILGRTEGLTRRFRALLPWGALALAYVALYKELGFGVHGSGQYIDPLSEPLAYLAALPVRLAVLANAALLGVPSELSTRAPHIVPVLATFGVVALAAFAWLLWRGKRDVPRELGSTLRWLLVGAVFATLPEVAGMPGDRGLLMPNLGITAALATVILHAGKRGENSSRLAAASAVFCVAVLALVHAVLGPCFFALEAGGLASMSHAAMTAATYAEIPLREGLRVWGIGTSDPLIGLYLECSLGLAPRPDPRPRQVHVLSMSSHDHLVRRTDDRTLEITVEGGALLEGALESLLRSPREPLHAGDEVPLGDWTVRVLADERGRPTRFAVSFDRSLDDPSMVFLVWKEKALRALVPPRVGQDVLVKHEPGPMGL
jgi:hypothetical protein